MAPLDVDRTRAGWWAIGGLLAPVLAAVLYAFHRTFVFGMFFYYATRPVYRRVVRRVPRGRSPPCSRSFSSRCPCRCCSPTRSPSAFRS